MAKKTSQSLSTSSEYDIVHLGRGRRPYKIARGKHGEFKSVMGPADEMELKNYKKQQKDLL